MDRDEAALFVAPCDALLDRLRAGAAADDDGAEHRHSRQPDGLADYPRVNKGAVHLLDGQNHDHEEQGLERTDDEDEQCADDLTYEGADHRHQRGHTNDHGDDLRVGEAEDEHTDIAEDAQDAGVRQLPGDEVREGLRGHGGDAADGGRGTLGQKSVYAAAREAAYPLFLREHVDGDNEGKAAGTAVMVFDFKDQQPDLQYETIVFITELIRNYSTLLPEKV